MQGIWGSSGDGRMFFRGNRGRAIESLKSCRIALLEWDRYCMILLAWSQSRNTWELRVDVGCEVNALRKVAALTVTCYSLLAPRESLNLK